MTTETITARKFALGNGLDEVRITRKRVYGNPAQVDAFDDYRARWLAETVEIAATMPSEFYFSQLKAKCGIAPAHLNWWGAVGDKLLKRGYKRSDTEYLHTKTGNKDFKWYRMEETNASLSTN